MANLTKINMSERRNFSLKREEIVRFLEEQVDPVEKILRQLQVKLDNFVNKEIDLFNRINIETASLSELNRYLFIKNFQGIFPKFFL